MSILKKRMHFPISVDSVIFGYKENELKVALIERKNEPFAGMWAIPGGFMEGNETIEETALRELTEETGIQDVYLEQFHVFSKPGRDPRGRTITVALFALIRADQSQLVATADAARSEWWPAYEIPPLAFDHNFIYEKALDALRRSFRTRPLAYQLLPKQFTLSNLQDLYEQVYGVKYDKRNFRKKIATMNFIKATGIKNRGKRRPAMLYEFDPKLYENFSREILF